MKLKIKKGAQVEVIAGSDKGKKGAVLEVKPLTMKIKVQGINMQTHFGKADKEGVRKVEGFFDYSNVKLLEQAPVKAKTTKKKASASKSA